MSESGKYVCAECIGDFIVKAEIKSGGRKRKCSYCKETGRAVAIELIADRMEDVYSSFVGEAELEAYFPDDSDKVERRQNGQVPSAIVSEMLECGYDEIASDIVGELSSRHSMADIMDGGTDIYDDSNDIFITHIPRSKEIAETWSAFCESIKHNRRFFNETASELLAEILEPIVNPTGAGATSAIRTIDPGSEERHVYRGRMANTFAARREILSKPINALGTPPREMNSAGRMNPAGIPVFYGSIDAATCAAELRAPVGGTAIVGKFEILRPIRVLDLTLLKNAMFNISYFDENVIRKHAYNRFLRGFHREIKKPVIPGSETLDYLPTQFIAEYLWTKVDPPLDGVIFGSAQTSEANAKNIALFPHAARAEGWYEELHPKPKAPAADAPAPTIKAEAYFEEASVLATEDVQPATEGPMATLRLVADGTVIAEVESIKYKLNARSVDLYEMDQRYAYYDEDDEYEPED